MTCIAVLADIHGNLPALEAVLSDIEQLAPDQVIVNGDVINRGPQSKECLQAVRATGWPVVFGNHEAFILEWMDGITPAEWRDEFFLSFWYAAEELSTEEIAFIRALPHHYVITIPGLPAIRLMHGNLRALNEGRSYAVEPKVIEG